MYQWLKNTHYNNVAMEKLKNLSQRSAMNFHKGTMKELLL